MVKFQMYVLKEKCREIVSRILGEKIFVQSDDRSDDGFTSLRDRAEGCVELKKEIAKKKKANRDLCAEIACKEWIDVRSFGQVFAFKGEEVSFRVERGIYLIKR